MVVQAALGLWFAAPMHDAGATVWDATSLYEASINGNLPDLPAGAAAPGFFDIAEDSAAISYETRFERWGAKVDQYMDVNPALTMDYGLQLTNRLGAGGTFTRRNEYSEVVLNGIYAPKRNLRFRMTGAQLRASTDAFSLSDSAGSAFMQNSYLFGAKKFWNKYEHLTDMGMTAYSVEASAPSSTRFSLPNAVDGTEAGELRAATLAPGRLNGYMFNVGLRPTPQSKLELRHEVGMLSYRYTSNGSRYEQLVSNRVKFSQYFGNCIRVQGGYSTSTDFDRLDLKLSKHNWNVRLSREQGGDNIDTAVFLGYAIPLGRTSRRAQDCAAGPEPVPSFEPIVNATTQRPQQIPREPLAIVETY
ncbi:hypothetical protein GCM10027343_09170 [Noviherbaspirillum agri]